MPGLLRTFWKAGQRPSAAWCELVAKLLNGVRSLSGYLTFRWAADGNGLLIDLDVDALANDFGLAAAPLRISISADRAHYSVSAGRVWTRGQTAIAVAAVADVAIAASGWIYVPITITTAGVATVGAIAASASEPAYYAKNGSNQSVINYAIGYITVTSGVAEIDWNRTGDIHLLARAGQLVAVSAADDPGYLYDLLANTGNVQFALTGAAPARGIAASVDIPGDPDYIDDQESRGVDGTYIRLSDSSSYDVVLDSRDYRGRMGESWCDLEDGNGAAVIPPESIVRWHIRCGCTDDTVIGYVYPYTLYVDGNSGALRLSAVVAAMIPAKIWVRASALLCAEYEEMPEPIGTYEYEECDISSPPGDSFEYEECDISSPPA